MASLTFAAAAGALIEVVIMRRLYHREHLDQVLATLPLSLFVPKAHVGCLVRFLCT